MNDKLHEEIKLLVGFEEDPSLQIKIESAIDYAINYCNNDFRDGDNRLSLPPAVKLGVAKLVESFEQTANVSSESVGGELSVSFF
ncbi:phage head-tail connector protein [Geomicrobium sp. JCM 19055]|uniref:phage head-tail connector protein n=1 Tax=Geomicrobium sp. JCM 19055 TaxID=1460649 RepID=UPI00045EDA06|nr:phage head-tail connector protein [Geomicrobium sp. JCM 19055]GAK01503.1 hypothetical protein JCM19055_4675 [Geomicrobium sp. JCM 19055]